MILSLYGQGKINNPGVVEKEFFVPGGDAGT